MLTRVFVAITFLACHLQAASLQSSESPQDLLDLEVVTLDAQGYPVTTLYYSYDQLLTLPAVTVKIARDPHTNTPATYTGIDLSNLFEAFGAAASFDVIGAKCADNSKYYYDRDYIARRHPMLLLKFDGKAPADWPTTQDGNPLGPYCVVHESFSPAEAVYGYVEQPRSPYGGCLV
jgi:hypothetical protein